MRHNLRYSGTDGYHRARKTRDCSAIHITGKNKMAKGRGARKTETDKVPPLQDRGGAVRVSMVGRDRSLDKAAAQDMGILSNTAQRQLQNLVKTVS